MVRAAGSVARTICAQDLYCLLDVGHILFSDLPIVTQTGARHALALAPMAVLPNRQRQGIGSRLAQEGLRACAEAGHRIVVVLGHADYYPRFGFSARLAEQLKAPFSGPSFMALELVPGALADVTGEVRYPPPFGLETPHPSSAVEACPALSSLPGHGLDDAGPRGQVRQRDSGRSSSLDSHRSPST